MAPLLLSGTAAVRSRVMPVHLAPHLGGRGVDTYVGASGRERLL
ncbi:hypothetical protein ACWGJT_18425 [Streptomyces xantholiticus]|uniref:Uncharacterized protein n=1 Tax=Streptomyces xantholiticus TaxID=68285 RepID=A0ABV1UUW0_9ACTN